jgi:carbamate kinase
MQTAVIALGGNAIMRGNKDTIEKQFENTRKTAREILFLAKKYKLVVTHGNGPQVGNIMIQIESAVGKAYPVPLSVAVAESQGQLGYMIEQAIVNESGKTDVAGILTQVVVDRNDKAFSNPTKPIGPFYTKEQSGHLKGMRVKEDSGRGWRRVVASPRPRQIVEAATIKKMLNSGIIVIAAGGGGIPVYKSGKKLVGVDAVIDKDLASACLAKSIGADLLIILTGVDNVYLNYGTGQQKAVSRLTVREAEKNMKHFAEGSMRPKMMAAVEFVRNGGRALITSPESLRKALNGRAGTWIVK